MIRLDKHFFKLLIFYSSFILISSSCSNESMHFAGNTMGTKYKVKVIQDIYLPVNKIQSDIDSVLNYINSTFSTYIPDSDINIFNRAKAQNTGIPVSEELMHLTLKAKDVHEKSIGLYDVTINK